MMADVKEKEFAVSEKVEDILDNYGAGLGKTSVCNGHFETLVCMNDDSYEYTHCVSHNGTEKDFLKELLDSLYAFDAADYAREQINEYEPSSVEDIEWYAAEARDIEEACQDMAGELYEYMQEEL